MPLIVSRRYKFEVEHAGRLWRRRHQEAADGKGGGLWQAEQFDRTPAVTFTSTSEVEPVLDSKVSQLSAFLFKKKKKIRHLVCRFMQ